MVCNSDQGSNLHTIQRFQDEALRVTTALRYVSESIFHKDLKINYVIKQVHKFAIKKRSPSKRIYYLRSRRVCEICI